MPYSNVIDNTQVSRNHSLIRKVRETLKFKRMQTKISEQQEKSQSSYKAEWTTGISVAKKVKELNEL
jgi:hypothetical protein